MKRRAQKPKLKKQRRSKSKCTPLPQRIPRKNFRKPTSKKNAVGYVDKITLSQSHRDKNCRRTLKTHYQIPVEKEAHSTAGENSQAEQPEPQSDSISKRGAIYHHTQTLVAWSTHN